MFRVGVYYSGCSCGCTKEQSGYIEEEDREIFIKKLATYLFRRTDNKASDIFHRVVVTPGTYTEEAQELCNKMEECYAKRAEPTAEAAEAFTNMPHIQELIDGKTLTEEQQKENSDHMASMKDIILKSFHAFTDVFAELREMTVSPGDTVCANFGDLGDADDEIFN